MTRTEQLEKFTTRKLLAMLRARRRSDYWAMEYGDEPPPQDFTKEEIKAVLATRPHVPNKIEAKKIRQDRANRGKKNR